MFQNIRPETLERVWKFKTHRGHAQPARNGRPECVRSEMPPTDSPAACGRAQHAQPAVCPVYVARRGLMWYSINVPKGAMFGFDYAPDRMPGVKSILGAWYCLGETRVRPLYRSSGGRVGSTVYVRIYRRPKEESECVTSYWEPIYASKTARRITNYILAHDYEYMPEDYHAPNGMRMSRYGSVYAGGRTPDSNVVTAVSVTAGCKIGPRWLSEEGYCTERMGMTSPDFD